jgi:hypothetical protein
MRGSVSLAVVLGIALLAAALGTPQGVADEATVVVSRPGTVFHKVGAADIRGRGHERTMTRALESGYTPCHVCFAPEARTSRSLAAGPTGTSITSATSGSFVLSGSLVAATTDTSGTFGLKQGVSELSQGAKGAKRDPYADLATVHNPGLEQGAYVSCSACSSGK